MRDAYLKSRIGISDSEVLICGEGIFVLTGSRLLHAAEKIIPEAKVSLEIELVSRFPTPVKCERISVSLQCKVRWKKATQKSDYNLTILGTSVVLWYQSALWLEPKHCSRTPSLRR